MPYKISRNPKGGFDIIRKVDGKTVGHSDNLKNAQGSIAHRMDSEKVNSGSMLHGAMTAKK